MSNDNLVILKGNLGEKPEIKRFESGGIVAQFSMATSRRGKDRAGNEKEETQWHNIAVKGPAFLVEDIEARFQKGATVMVRGMLEHRKWTDRDGKEQWFTEVVVRPYIGFVDLISRAPKNNRPGADDPYAGRTASQKADAPHDLPSSLDDDIAF